MRIGVISDTHGLLRPSAVTALENSDLIVHAGDIGSIEVLLELERIAPVHAVRGNNDSGAWAKTLPATLAIEVASCRIYALHDLKEFDVDGASEGWHAIISGHSHKPTIQWRDGVLFFNPGSAGPRRFKLPVSVGTIDVRRGKLIPKLLNLSG
jgi:putative phosphoesterase